MNRKSISGFVFHSKKLAVFSAVAAASASSACDHHQVNADAPRGPTADAEVKLLTANFEPRAIRKIEVGDFHLTGGQAAPVHTHLAPALGYVSKGAILYQIEGRPAQVLKAGDAFYEPVGPQILHFDNASQTDEAVFTDFNFERGNEPFIVFAKPPVNLKIDRRTFPTVEISAGPALGRIDICSRVIQPGASVSRSPLPLPVMGYVADGTIEVHGASGPISIATGQSFDIPAGQSDVTLGNSSNAPAKVITFEPIL